MSKTLTIREVARNAGVSTATVSRVLNADPKVRPPTAAKVLEVVREMDYRRNHAARSLKTSRSRSIGIIAPEFKNDFFMSIVTGIEEFFRQEGYSVILCSSREELPEEKARLELLKEKNVDGAIIIPGSGQGEHFHRIRPAPVVLVDRLVQGFDCDAVLSDNRQGSFDAVSLSFKRGARRIGFLGGNISLSSAKERYEGYLEAHKAAGLEADPDIILFGDYHEKSGYTLMHKLMNRAKAPQHIFISNYFMHLGALRCLLEQKSSPRNIHIISFDELPLASFFPYSRIIVAQAMEDIGRKAAGLLLERINGKKGKSRIMRLPTSLKILPPWKGFAQPKNVK